MTSIVVAQLNPCVGNIEKNTSMILRTLEKVSEKHPNSLVVFPEMMLSGYCPQDLLLYPDFIEQCERAVQTLAPHTETLAAIVGTPHRDTNGQLINTAIVYEHGKIIHQYGKQYLPNYGVFDENRYFQAGKNFCQIRLRNCTIGVLICEDSWQIPNYQYYQKNEVDIIVAINASPYHHKKHQQRVEKLKEANRKSQRTVLYVNQCGAQDELVFDGGSFCVYGDQSLIQLPEFEEGIYHLTLPNFPATSRKKTYHTLWSKDQSYQPNKTDTKADEDLRRDYLALLYGLRDYTKKNGFNRVMIGLSGGVDSAFTLALTVDALGAESVTAVMLTSQYTSEKSVNLASKQAKLLNVSYHNLSISQSAVSVENELLRYWKELPSPDAISRQNIQARLRATILMAMSNQENALLLSSGNKSEIAVGYATLYGDMAGGFAPIKDVYKTHLYRLAYFRNTQSPAILEEIIQREPTAELAPEQKDRDSLPSYDTLDSIIKYFIEDNLSPTAIIAKGYPEDMVRNLIKTIARNQHKRSQAAIGTKISARSFGRDFRYPNTQQFF